MANIKSKNRFYTHMANHDKSMVAGKEAERAEGKARDEKRMSEAIGRMEAAEPKEDKERAEFVASMKNKTQAPKKESKTIHNKPANPDKDDVPYEPEEIDAKGEEVNDNWEDEGDEDDDEYDPAYDFENDEEDTDVKAGPSGLNETWKEHQARIDAKHAKKVESPLTFVDWKLPKEN
jgi:hypothetical protein